eukprot:1155214-Pelagomonas_calceolata.AAC.2
MGPVTGLLGLGQNWSFVDKKLVFWPWFQTHTGGFAAKKRSQMVDGFNVLNPRAPHCTPSFPHYVGTRKGRERVT